MVSSATPYEPAGRLTGVANTMGDAAGQAVTVSWAVPRSVQIVGLVAGGSVWLPLQVVAQVQKLTVVVLPTWFGTTGLPTPWSYVVLVIAVIVTGAVTVMSNSSAMPV